MLIVDAFPGVGNLFEAFKLVHELENLLISHLVFGEIGFASCSVQAFTTIQQTAAYPLHYIPLYPCENDAEWFMHLAAHDLRDRFRKGNLKVAGYTRQISQSHSHQGHVVQGCRVSYALDRSNQIPPAEHLVAAPSPPELKRMVYSKARCLHSHGMGQG